MKVSKLMSRPVCYCSPDDSLAAAAGLMWKHDCGFVPLVCDGKVVGTITDRDIAIAAAGRNEPAGQITISKIATRKPVTCAGSDSVKKALKKMKKQRVRRLPVTTEEGELTGVISIADIIHATKKDKALRKKVLSALRAISAPCPIVLSEMR